MSSPKKLRREKSAARRRARKRMKVEIDQPMTDERGAEPEGRRPEGTRPQADPAPPQGGAGGEAAVLQDGSGGAHLDPKGADVSGGHISKHAGDRARRDLNPRLPLLPGGFEDRSSVPRDDRWRRLLRKGRPADGMVNRRYPPVRPQAAKGREPWSDIIDTRDDFVASELDRLELPFTEYYGDSPAWSSPGPPSLPTPSPVGGYWDNEDSFLDAVILPGVKPDRNLGPPKKRWRSGWSATRLPPESRTWAEGWDRREYCPIDPMRNPRESGHRFHGKLDTDSTASWTPIPRQAGHRFHGKLDTDSTASWTPHLG